MEKLTALYASALFDLAKERGDIDESLDQATFLADTLSDAEIRAMLFNPRVPKDQKQNLLTKELTGHVHDDLLGFINLAIEKNRQTFIISTLVAYINLIKKHKNIVMAKVISAAELDSNQATELRDSLSERLGKTVTLSMKVDPSVVAGPYIYVDGYYLDWTFKTRLSDLVVHMKEGCTA
jgi:F-type H+-transporting ATPase subunit delta